MADQITLSASDGSESESESNPENSSQYPTHLTEFNSAWQRRNQEPSEERQSSNPVQAGLSTTRKVKKANQPSIKNHLDSSWKYKQIRTQEDLDKAILNHLIADLLPFSEVEKEAFKNLIGGLSGPLVIRSRPFMVELLKKTYSTSKADLILELDKADYVSTTADCWTSRRRSFLGMAVHWMGQDLDRRTADEDMSHDEDEKDDFVFIDIGDIMNCGPEEVDLGDADNDLCLKDHIHLPTHMRCSCHSLNLVATTDVKNIDSVRFQN
ncbi:uncharacterized protein LOC123467616 [Daphnia magna]|uniref:uncharacterized protein LOC123467616 n=1 Tax=Daphnia magna TaxID=35525 RepID=UPI001E1BB066|nr:uncharacterized protein LOC123467616 [Daphnia magna]